MLEAEDGLDLRQKNRVEETIGVCGFNRGEFCSARLKVWEAAKRALISVASEASNLPAETRADMLIPLGPAQVCKFAARSALTRNDEEELPRKDRADFEAASRPS
ncbi:MAG: hypothetical protein C0504_00805 [Candidatus Solibacter sp.]|nr:hypothetical protein [Candidatus Solibacter sp.]